MKSVAVSVVEPIVNPPILPLSATIVPDIETAEAVICPLDFNIKLLFELLTVVAEIPNPPISPEVAFTLPLISKPAADADRAVVFASVFISKAVPVSFKCLPTVEPIVVVPPNEAVVCPLRIISKLSESILAKLLASFLILTSAVDIET